MFGPCSDSPERQSRAGAGPAEQPKGPASAHGRWSRGRNLASRAEAGGTVEMPTHGPSVPEKFSSALQPGALLDLLQIEGMKIEEESEVRWSDTPSLSPCHERRCLQGARAPE